MLLYPYDFCMILVVPMWDELRFSPSLVTMKSNYIVVLYIYSRGDPDKVVVMSILSATVMRSNSKSIEISGRL